MNAHKPMAQVAEDFVFFLSKQEDGTRWPVGTKLYAESPLIAAAPMLFEALAAIVSINAHSAHTEVEIDAIHEQAMAAIRAARGDE